MRSLQAVLDDVCTETGVPGVVAAVSRPGVSEFASAGVRELAGVQMSRDTIVRIASLTKPIVAAAAAILIERGRLDAQDEVRTWLPELAEPRVLRTPDSELDDTVPAVRPITVDDLLTFQAGLGFPAEGGAHVVPLLLDRLAQGPPRPQAYPEPDEWMRRAAELPLVHQPGQGWTYHTGADLLGVLLERLEGQSLTDVLIDTLFGPLRMTDTSFSLPAEKLPRMSVLYERLPNGGEDGLQPVDEMRGQWFTPPPFRSGGGGLLSTVSDLHVFFRMLADGGYWEGRLVMGKAARQRLLTARVPSSPGHPFLAGQSWSAGGAVDVAELESWNRLGRYGWVGGTGTAGYVHPDSGTVQVWLTQQLLAGPNAAEDPGTVALGRFLTATSPGSCVAPATVEGGLDDLPG
ncbi:MAG: serine hydrolase domain-containing protein [Actinomycetales bacterium]